ncbi:MAG: hypothetical protein RLZZ366_1568 [Pseudomonadota bacterium]
MLATLLRTSTGAKLAAFMISKRGQTLDRWCLTRLGISPMMLVVSKREGFAPMPLLVIHSIGRKSGQPRSAVMPYVRMDGKRYVVASNGNNLEKDPAWVDNLRAKSDISITVDRKTIKVRARLLDPASEERARLWVLAVVASPLYQTFQNGTTRRIPVIALDET